jgi:hypothetical protein
VDLHYVVMGGGEGYCQAGVPARAVFARVFREEQRNELTLVRENSMPVGSVLIPLSPLPSKPHALIADPTSRSLFSTCLPEPTCQHTSSLDCGFDPFGSACKSTTEGISSVIKQKAERHWEVLRSSCSDPPQRRLREQKAMSTFQGYSPGGWTAKSYPLPKAARRPALASARARFARSTIPAKLTKAWIMPW